LTAKNRKRALLALLGLVLGVWVGWKLLWFEHERSIEFRLKSLETIIQRHATRTGLDAEFIRAVIRCESGGRAKAVSKKNALGLMQVMDDAESDALRILKAEKGDLFDPEYNILIGTTYLKWLHDRFDGDDRLALAAYHMGAKRVRQIQADNPGISGEQLVNKFANPTTRAYVNKVFAVMEERKAVAEK